MPQLFPTPPELAARVVKLAEIGPSDRVLEPSAGTGALIDQVPISAVDIGRPQITAVEINKELAAGLIRYERTRVNVVWSDFLTCTQLGQFDRIVMNPPFANGQDVDHVTHALGMLKPTGVLVAIMSGGVRFRSDRQTTAFRKSLDAMDLVQWWDLPPNAFAEADTMVATVMLRVTVAS